MHIISSESHLVQTQNEFQRSLKSSGQLFSGWNRLTITAWWGGNCSAPSAFSDWCQSKEITGEVSPQEWKLNRSVFWLNMPIPITSYLSGIRVLIISPSHQSVFLHQGKQVSVSVNPLNFIRRLIFLFIYFFCSSNFKACCAVSKKWKWSSQVEGGLARQVHWSLSVCSSLWSPSATYSGIFVVFVLHLKSSCILCQSLL